MVGCGQSERQFIAVSYEHDLVPTLERVRARTIAGARRRSHPRIRRSSDFGPPPSRSGAFSQADSGNRAPSCRPSALVDKLSKGDDLRAILQTKISACCPGIADGHNPTFDCRLIFAIHGPWS